MKRTAARQTQPKAKAERYSRSQLTKDLEVVRDVYENLSRDRFAIYDYWRAVYRLRRKWRRLEKDGVNVIRIASHAVTSGVPTSSGDDLLRLIIDLTMATTSDGPQAAIKLSKLKSKYFSLLNYAFASSVATRQIKEFIAAHGGLNFNPSGKSTSSTTRRKQKS